MSDAPLPPYRGAVEADTSRLARLAWALGLALLATLLACVTAWHLVRPLLDALAVACGAGALFGIAYTLLASLMLRRFFMQAQVAPSTFPPVTIVKPLHGSELALLDNLASFCRQDYPGPVQFLFGVQDAHDPALHAVEALRRLYPEAQIEVVADTRLYGPNRKISNLINMMPQARHDFLVFADSDIQVGASYLRHVIGALHQPGVGLVTCVYRGQPDPGFWPRLSAQAINYQFLPSVVVGLASRLAQPCFGQTIAMRREMLAQIGGFLPFVHHLAEDHAIGAAVRATGATIAIPPFAIAHACVETSLAQLVAHEMRWSRTIRGIDPLGHLGSVLIHPLAFAVLAVLLSGGGAWAWLLSIAALAARLALKLRADRMLQQAHRDFWLLPLWDLAAFVIFVASFFSTRVIWRGFSFEVDHDGLLSSLRDE